MRKSGDLWCYTSAEKFIEYLNGCQYDTMYKTPKSKHGYSDVTATFDIETTNRETDGFAYSFQMNIGGQNCVVRYIEDFIAICEAYVKKHYGRLVLYIHNLGYEFFYTIQILKERWGIADALYTKPRKPLYIRFLNGIEFRDSLKLFQKSLAALTKGLPHEKLAGDLNYSMYRTPDTPLSPDEWNYCVNDVQGLYEAIERLKSEHGYNAATIPLTNTAMVIEEVNRCISGDAETFKAFEELVLSKRQMALAYNCMAGGDTHGTRWRAGKIYWNCNSYDLKSAHPSQQILRKFPSGGVVDMSPQMDESDLLSVIREDRGWLGKVYIDNFRIRPECPNPTISVSKTEEIEGSYGYDNGRLLGAESVIVYMDSNDFQRFREAYTYDGIMLIQGIEFGLAYLPDAFRKAILDKFRIKESLSGGPEYMFSKICVNTIFGACAQKVIRDKYDVHIGECIEVDKLSWEDNLERKSAKEVRQAQLSKFPFLWGLWTASLSRLELWNLQKAVGWERIIYWDTDSVKYEGEKIPAVDAYNESVREECRNRNAIVIGKKGTPVYIGVAEDEHPTVPYGYRSFTFLHAKCYAAESYNVSRETYEIETTIAGVRKTNGRDAMKGDIANLKPGLIINDAGGLSLSYHDRPITERHEWKRPTKTASYIVMTPRMYLVKGDLYDEIEIRDDINC